MSILSVKIKASVFREYDIRGITGRDLDADFAELLGLAYAKFVSARKPAADRANFTVAVGKDCRLTSDDYANGLIRGLTRGGLDVIRIGVCPTPLTYFSVYHYDLDGAIMVTGSHNPADYNGFKISVGRDTLFGEQIQTIKTLMEDALKEPSTKPIKVGTVSAKEIIAPYIVYLVKNAQPLKQKKIVLDSGNGTAGAVAPLLFRKLGADVISLFDKLDGRFPNHHPDPTIAENLTALSARVLKEKADFGIAFDGDSDRIGVVDEKGRLIYGDELLVLFSRDILSEIKGATIISEVKSSHRLYNDILARGGRPIMWKAGHSLIKSKMKQENAVLAGEMSGHIFFSDRYFGFDDAIYAGLRLYELACKQDKPLSSLLEDLPACISTPEIRVDCDENLKFALVKEVTVQLKNLASQGSFQVIDIDGVRIDFGDAWGVVRASNTQPALVFRFEASTHKQLNELRTLIETQLKSATQALGHPSILLPA